MTAERVDYYPSQQILQGYAIEEGVSEQPLHLTTAGQTLGNIERQANDHFSIPNHAYRTVSQAEVIAWEEDRQDIVEKAIRGRTIDLGSIALTSESIFVFNPEKQTESPELA